MSNLIQSLGNNLNPSLLVQLSTSHYLYSGMKTLRVLLFLSLLSFFGCSDSSPNTEVESATPPQSNSSQPEKERSKYPGASDHPGQALFEKNCVSCHDGRHDWYPNLNQLPERRDREWVISFIKNPQKLYDHGDPLATQVIDEWQPKVGVMSSFEYLSDEEMESLISYLGFE